MNLDAITSVLISMGCPPEKSEEMASQLHKRAQQLAEYKGRPYEEAMGHLLNLMREGWSARERRG